MKLNKINKKAVSHIEIIISFVVFVVFVIFLLAIFNPLKNTSSDTGAPNRILFYMEERGFENLSSVSINADANKVQSKQCFKIDPIIDLKCDDKQLIAKDSSGNIIGAIKNTDAWYIGLSGGDTFYTLYCSKDINPVPYAGDKSKCKYLSSSDYTSGVINTQLIWSGKKLSQIQDDYSKNYAGLRSEFLNNAGDFAFNITDLIRQIAYFQGAKTIPKKINVYSGSSNIEYFDKDANINQAVLTITAY